MSDKPDMARLFNSCLVFLGQRSGKLREVYCQAYRAISQFSNI